MVENKQNEINKGLVSLKQKLEEIKKANKLKKDIIDYFYGIVSKRNKNEHL